MNRRIRKPPKPKPNKCKFGKLRVPKGARVRGLKAVVSGGGDSIERDVVTEQREAE